MNAPDLLPPLLITVALLMGSLHLAVVSLRLARVVIEELVDLFVQLIGEIACVILLLKGAARILWPSRRSLWIAAISIFTWLILR